MQAVRLSCWTLMRDSVYYTISVTALIVVSRSLSGFSCSHKAYGPPHAAGEEKQVALPWGPWPAAQDSYLPTLSACVPSTEEQQTQINRTQQSNRDATQNTLLKIRFTERTNCFVTVHTVS